MDARRTGTLIRSLREERGLTQLQLAEPSASPTRRCRSGSAAAAAPTSSLLGALASELGSPVETLLAGTLSADERKEAP